MKQTATLRFIMIAKGLALAGLIFLAGCSNVLTPQVKAPAPAHEPGTGTVRIDIAGSGARTLLPAAVGTFARYDLLFTASGEDNVTVSPYTLNSPVTLAEGTWTLTVSAYVGAGDTVAAATGTDTVTVTYGVEGTTTTVTLDPEDTFANDSITGQGTFSWDISFPAAAASVQMAITRLDGSAVQTLYLKGGTPPAGTTSTATTSAGSIANLPAGSYYVTTTLKKTGNPQPTAIRRDALYILKGLTTTADAAAGYTFTDDDFSSVRYVTSAADTNTAGTLRYVITNAVVGDTIQVTLPKGSVITLTSALPQITKNVTIEGNGVTLTQSGFAGTTQTPLLDLGSGVVATIRRIHFKDGRSLNYGAAVRSYSNSAGSITLESCIFTGNQTVGQLSKGGAIYADNGTLTVLGCTFYNNSATDSGGAIYKAFGAVKLGGNFFYGNTADSGKVYNGNVSLTSLGYNVSDMQDGVLSGTDTTHSGWAFLNGDAEVTASSISRFSFKPKDGSAVLSKVDASAFNTANGPAITYPTADFYGDPIPAAAAATGAVQTANGPGSELVLIIQGPGAVTPNVEPNGEGLYGIGSSVTLTAAPSGSANYFAVWTVDGVKQGDTGPLTVILSDDTEVKAVFGREVTVTGSANTGDGTLSAALVGLQDYDRITLDNSLTGQTITLTAALPRITKSVTIEGNGVTLTQSGFAGTTRTPLLYIDSSTADVTIRRLHFKDGRSSDNAALSNYGTLTLESCIFSGNQGITGDGGAIGNRGPSLTILGSTFYNNRAAANGGAIFSANSVVTLAGNLFYGNTATTSSKVVYLSSGTAVSLGYNISDLPGGTGNNLTSGGFAFATGDETVTALSVSPVSFKPSSGSDVLGKVAVSTFTAANPTIAYPRADFYGAAISAVTAAAGAVQTAGTGYGFALITQGTGEISGGPVPDADGFVTANAGYTLTATPADTFVFWVVNGTKQAETTNQLTGTVTGNTEIRAVFGRNVAVTSTDNGTTTDGVSLRWALATMQDYDIITLPEGLITLTAVLPNITKSVTIEGNGATLTRSFTEGSNTALLYISSAAAEVTVRRVHFKDGRNTNYGGAVYSVGKLTLESCIFSGNNHSSQVGAGGAVANIGGSATVLGCTFYNNSAPNGGAIYNTSGSAVLTLAGNFFYGNTASTSRNVVYSDGGTVTSLGYNISDMLGGVGNNLTTSGFAFVTGDDTVTAASVSPVSFKPTNGSALLNKDLSGIPNYPAKDFYGVSITKTSAAIGAVQTPMAAGKYELNAGYQGPGTLTASGGSPDGDGLYSSGASVTLTAAPADGDKHLAFWTINGVKQAGAPGVISVTENMEIRGVFGRIVTVSSGGNGTTSDGVSLRWALTNAQEYDKIVVGNGVGTITLSAVLPDITKSLTLEGSSVILTGNVKLLKINNAAAEVTIRRVHFKGGRSGNTNGGAINSKGTLTLESCIFSGNQTTLSSSYYGGAVWFDGKMTVLGCTFYENKTGYGGALSRNTGSLTLAGNLFYGNTASSGNTVLYGTAVVSLGYNVSDKLDGANTSASDTTHSGWVFVTGDKTLTAPTTPPVDPVDATHPYVPTAAALGDITIVPDTLTDYPAEDFYGTPRPAGTIPAGAVWQ
jgi:hypothetical protein